LSQLSHDHAIPPELEAEIDEAGDRFEEAWQSGAAPRLEDYVRAASEAARPYILRELIALERHYRRDASGTPLDDDALLALHPELAAPLAGALDALAADAATRRPSAPVGESAGPGPPSDVQLAGGRASRGLHVRCPHCSNPMELLADTPYDDVTCRTCGSTFNLVDREGPTESAPALRKIGRFELVSRLGVGGFGTVWKARDTELDRLVAVKIPRKGQLSADEVAHFFREARAAAQLRHPNIVSVYEVGREEETVFIVSDYVRGVSLADWLTGATPSFRDVAQLGADIAMALHHAHEQGVIHRDLKPSNVMIDEAGAPHIMDFGLAKRDLGEITMTLDGQILGTPAYMSPEQARGKSHWTDRRTDVYSLGTVLFRLLTGELPFRGNARMQLHHKLTNDAPDPRRLNQNIPRDLSTICLKCLERDPNHRYATARDVGAELQRFLRGEPILARPLSVAARTWRWALRKPAVATAAALALTLAIGGPLVAWQQSRLYRREAELNRQLQTRIEERNRLVGQHSQQVNLQSATADELRTQLAGLRGQVPGIEESLPGWRLSLVQQLADQGLAASSTRGNAEEKPDDLDRARWELGLGILLQQLHHREEALAHLRAAQERLVRLRTAAERDTALADTLADCLLRISQLERESGEAEAADRALAEASRLRKDLAERGASEVRPQVRLLETTMGALAQLPPGSKQLKLLELVPQITQRIAKNWPTDPAEFYELACLLTLGDPLLRPATLPPRP
jgi:ribosomal protein S27E